jgi:hypothetical protein
MCYVICIMLLPFIAYGLYEDWKDAVEYRYQRAGKS